MNAVPDIQHDRVLLSRRPPVVLAAQARPIPTAAVGVGQGCGKWHGPRPANTDPDREREGIGQGGAGNDAVAINGYADDGTPRLGGLVVFLQAVGNYLCKVSARARLKAPLELVPHGPLQVV